MKPGASKLFNRLMIVVLASVCGALAVHEASGRRNQRLP